MLCFFSTTILFVFTQKQVSFSSLGLAALSMSSLIPRPQTVYLEGLFIHITFKKDEHLKTQSIKVFQNHAVYKDVHQG